MGSTALIHWLLLVDGSWIIAQSSWQIAHGPEMLSRRGPPRTRTWTITRALLNFLGHEPCMSLEPRGPWAIKNQFMEKLFIMTSFDELLGSPSTFHVSPWHRPLLSRASSASITLHFPLWTACIWRLESPKTPKPSIHLVLFCLASKVTLIQWRSVLFLPLVGWLAGWLQANKIGAAADKR